MDVITPIPCPLCGYASHPGKCPKTQKGKWWCGPCLLEKLPPGERLNPQPLSNAALILAGVKRTNKWCVRCGAPVCEDHGCLNSASRRSRPRCFTKDCRARSPSDVETLRFLLRLYVPDFLTAGPIRCVVCALPAMRRKLCSRHYEAVRSGKRILHVDRQRSFAGEPVKKVIAYVNYATFDVVKDLAEEDSVSLSRWVVELLDREIARRRGVSTRTRRVVI